MNQVPRSSPDKVINTCEHHDFTPVTKTPNFPKKKPRGQNSIVIITSLCNKEWEKPFVFHLNGFDKAFRDDAVIFLPFHQNKTFKKGKHFHLPI